MNFLVNDVMHREKPSGSHSEKKIAVDPRKVLYSLKIFLKILQKFSWKLRVSIPVPRACEARALPIELSSRCFDQYRLLYFKTISRGR